VQFRTLFKLQDIRDNGVDDSQYLHSLTYVDLDNETLRYISGENVDRLAAISKALDYIVRQRSVSERTMRSVLTAEQFAAYVESFNWSMSPAEDDQSVDIPWQLQEYMQQIRSGDRYTRIANLFKRCKKRDHNGRTAFGRYEAKAFGCYEEAVMDLLNYIDTDPKTNPNADATLAGEILRCLDRDVSAEHGQGPDISASGVPRVRGTKSKYTQIDAEPVVGERLRKHWRQREALCAAALELIYDEPDEALTEQQQEKLRQRFLSNFGIVLKKPDAQSETGISKMQRLLDELDEDE
jgi:hypothetical protein